MTFRRGSGQLAFVLSLMLVLSGVIPGHRVLICSVIAVWALLFKFVDRIFAREAERHEAAMEYARLLVKHGMSPKEALKEAKLDGPDPMAAASILGDLERYKESGTE